MSIWDWLLNPSGLTPHGFCLSWAPGLVTIHVVSDVLIGLSYFSIPLAIAAFVRRRPDLRYGWVAYLFVAFILACGTTHLMAILTLWVPAYGIEGLIKMATAILSIATAAILWPLIPRAAALPSAAQLEQLNIRLRESEAEARLSNLELERRVAERTGQLERANAQLTEALAERSQAQQALARNEAEYRASFEAAAVGKIQTDPLTGKYIRVNRAFAHMLGYEPEDLIGQDGWSFTWPEDREEGREGYARLLSGEVSTITARSATCDVMGSRSGDGCQGLSCGTQKPMSPCSPSGSSRTSMSATRPRPLWRPPSGTWKTWSRRAPRP